MPVYKKLNKLEHSALVLEKLTLLSPIVGSDMVTINNHVCDGKRFKAALNAT